MVTLRGRACAGVSFYVRPRRVIACGFRVKSLAIFVSLPRVCATVFHGAATLSRGGCVLPSFTTLANAVLQQRAEGRAYASQDSSHSTASNTHCRAGSMCRPWPAKRPTEEVVPEADIYEPADPTPILHDVRVGVLE